MLNKKKKKDRKSRGGTGVSPVSSELRMTRRNLPHWQRGGEIYFVTFRIKKAALSEEERSLVLSACLHWHQRKWKLYAVLVMPDHVHLLAQPLGRDRDSWYALVEILHSIKSYTAHKINKLRRRAGIVWLDESFDRIVRDEKESQEKLLYMARNPLKAGLARTEGEHFLFLV